MKRFWSTAEYARQQRHRRRKAELRRLSSGAKQRIRFTPRIVNLTSPADLSLFEQPEQTITFCNDLRNALSRPHTAVRLDLSGVTRFSSDVLLVMRAVMKTKARRCG